MSEEHTPVAADASAPDYKLVVSRALDLAQAAIYLVAALLLILLALMAFFVIGSDMNNIVRGSMTIGAIDVVLSDILIVFVITGPIQTLIVYIKSHTIDPWLVPQRGPDRHHPARARLRRPGTALRGRRPAAVLLFVVIIGLYLIDWRCHSVSRRE
jgi:hypothetical protein